MPKGQGVGLTKLRCAVACLKAVPPCPALPIKNLRSGVDLLATYLTTAVLCLYMLYLSLYLEIVFVKWRGTASYGF